MSQMENGNAYFIDFSLTGTGPLLIFLAYVYVRKRNVIIWHMSVVCFSLSVRFSYHIVDVLCVCVRAFFFCVLLFYPWSSTHTQFCIIVQFSFLVHCDHICFVCVVFITFSWRFATFAFTFISRLVSFRVCSFIYIFFIICKQAHTNISMCLGLFILRTHVLLTLNCLATFVKHK